MKCDVFISRGKVKKCDSKTTGSLIGLSTSYVSGIKRRMLREVLFTLISAAHHH